MLRCGSAAIESHKLLGSQAAQTDGDQHAKLARRRFVRTGVVYRGGGLKRPRREDDAEEATNARRGRHLKASHPGRCMRQPSAVK